MSDATCDHWVLRRAWINGAGDYQCDDCGQTFDAVPDKAEETPK